MQLLLISPCLLNYLSNFSMHDSWNFFITKILLSAFSVKRGKEVLEYFFVDRDF